MSNEQTVRVHFISGETRIVPAKDIQHVGEEGAQRGTALVDGREIPIYLRVEWGWTWEEQEVSTMDERAAEVMHEFVQAIAGPSLAAEEQTDTVMLVKCPYCGGHHQKYMVDACPLNPYKVR